MSCKFIPQLACPEGKFKGFFAIFCFFLAFVLLVLPCSAIEYSSLEDLVNDVQEVIPPYDFEEDNVVDDVIVGPSEDFADVGPFDPSVMAINELVDLLAQESTSTSFNMQSAQVLYLKGIAVNNPLMDYVLTYDGNQTYGLYYGYNLSVGKTANYAYVTRIQSGSTYFYQYNTGLSATVPSTRIYVSSIDNSLPCFEEVSGAKAQIIFEICACVALGLWVLGKLLFR